MNPYESSLYLMLYTCTNMPLSVYLTSILVSFYALFVCSEGDEDPTLPYSDPIQWLRVAKGTRFICSKWEELVGPAWIASSGVFYGKPDMTDDTEIFKNEYGRPFVKLLTFAEDFEAMSAEDREVYRQVICYIGNIYKGIVEGTDDPLGTCRRLIAAPSKNEPRFIELLEAKQPRAMTILAHMFACMKLIEEQVQWFKGIAERQVPKIHSQIPPGWHPMMVCIHFHLFHPVSPSTAFDIICAIKLSENPWGIHLAACAQILR